jgi:hypothetical protein
MAMSGYGPPPPPPLSIPNLMGYVTFNLCRVSLTRPGAACTAIPSLRKCRHPPSITSVSGSCTPLSSYPSVDFPIITRTLATFILFYLFSVSFVASFASLSATRFRLCCRIIFAVCLLSLSLCESFSATCHHYLCLAFSDNRFHSGYPTGQYIYISVTYLTLIIMTLYVMFWTIHGHCCNYNGVITIIYRMYTYPTEAG